MADYCIMRMAKIKSTVSLVHALQHNTRERIPYNADGTRTPDNWQYFEGGATQNKENALLRYTNLLPAKVRKNAVHAVEVMMTASPQFAGDWSAYLTACDDWARKFFGEENVLHVAYHNDELTPHVHVIAMPLVAGKLNAKALIGGSSRRMQELQDQFHKEVGGGFGLSRGIPREETHARHKPHDLSAAKDELARRSAELDEREQSLADKEQQLNQREAEIKRNIEKNFNEKQNLLKEREEKQAKELENYKKSRDTGLRDQKFPVPYTDKDKKSDKTKEKEKG